MEGSDGSPPPSLCMIRAAELFPKSSMEKEDNLLTVPFQELAGESVKYLGRIDDGVLALSNYRLFLKNTVCSETSVPLGLIETAQIRDLFHLLINCKDASTVKCSFETAEQCSEWCRRITLSVGVPESLESLFAFPFYSWTADSAGLHQQKPETLITNGVNGTVGNQFTSLLPQSTSNHTVAGSAGNNLIENGEWSGRLQRSSNYDDDFRREVERLQFDLNGAWRISKANSEFKLCPSYPPQILVPCCISDDLLKDVANFRGSRRLPAVVWRHKQSGAVIARCSQPEVGWFGWRSKEDEQLLKALADACAFDRGEQSRRQNLCTSGESTPSSPEGSHEEVVMDEVRKILIVDARSYTSAVTNRARGGGCECIEYYPSAEIEFMNLGNIHVIRKSFHALRQLCSSPSDVQNWLGLLERTLWFQHLSGLMAASMTVCHAIEKKGRPVLVHCSDGWDRTPQIVATAQLCLDPYYRTVEGFRILVEREWLNFGHKFADRCGHGPGSDEINERCPVFIQWLDIVHQIHKQFPCCFEFSMAYLIKLAQHSHSCLFGTFLCNTLKERIDNSVLERTFSVWPFLSGPMYRNALYVANKEKVLWPAHNVRDIALWTEVYFGSLGNQNSSDFPPNTAENNHDSKSPMAKTRSYGDLITAGVNQNGLIRRSSDPNMTLDSHLMSNHSDNNSINDELRSEREISPDVLVANIIHDTTEKLQNLTNELNQSDEEICKINKVTNFTNSSNNANNIRVIPSNTLENSFLQKLNIENNIEDDYSSDHDNGILIKNTNLSNHNGDNNDDDTSNTKNILNEIHCNENSKNESNHINVYNKTSSHDEVKLSNHENGNGHIDGYSFKTVYSTDCIDGNLETKVDVNSSSMMESIDLRDSSETRNFWYGSVNTSTDTLVPVESQQISVLQTNDTKENRLQNHDTTNTNFNLLNNQKESSYVNIRDDTNFNNRSKISNNILPEVHCKPNLAPTTTTGLNNFTNYTMNNLLMDESIFMLPEYQKLEISSSGKCETINTITNPSTINRRRRTSSSNSKHDGNSLKTNGSSSTTNSRFSTPGIRSLPLTPPAIIERCAPNAISCPDGLGHALSEESIRLQQIVYEHKIRVDALLRELHGMRIALLKKSCPNCSNGSNDEHVDVMMVNQEIYDNCYYTASNHGKDGVHLLFDPESVNPGLDNIENSSVCSWEAIEDRSGPSSGASSTQPTGNVLWVPDHAVNRCTGCQTEFWLGRRKHHCRSCGQIFCSDCSEFWTPVPEIRLYKPVRVCGPCYQTVTTRIQEQNCRLGLTVSHNQYQAPQTVTNLKNNCSTSLNINMNLLSSMMPMPNSNQNNNNIYINSSSSSSSCSAVTPTNAPTATQIISSVVLSTPKLEDDDINAGGLTTQTAATASSTTDACKHTINRNDHCGPLKATTASN